MIQKYENSLQTIVNPSCRPLIISNLREAAASIKRLNVELDAERLYRMGKFSVEMGHIYHHLNVAWNIRSLGDVDLYRKMSDENFDKWTQFPTEKFYWAK